MADISAIFFILMMLGIAFPALLMAWWLLFPSLVERARVRIEDTPRQSFGIGIVFVIAVSLPIGILLALPLGPAKLMGWILLAAALTVSSIGSAGIAAHLADRISRQGSFPPISSFLRGAVVLELAAFLPILGWFFVWPLMLITACGASGFALLNWMPRPGSQSPPVNASTSNA